MSVTQIREEDIRRYGKNVAPQLPWSIQLCITYGCNRAPVVRNRYTDEVTGEIKCKGGCMFCGSASIIDKETDRPTFNHMKVETAVELAKQFQDWIPSPSRRFEINNFGEPMLNPHWREIVKALRDNYPGCCIQLQTNGVGTFNNYDRFKNMVDDFFFNGGNLLAIDSYEGSYKYYIEYGKRYEKETGVKCIDFMHDNPENMTYYRNAGSDTKELYIVDDLGECDYKEKTTKDKKAQRSINNHAGCVDRSVWKQFGIDVNSLPLQKKCSRVFRELIIGCDGTVTICCQDFLRRVNLGNILETNVRDIWNSEEFNTIRKYLYDKDRSFCDPCRFCSYTGGFRLGFLKRPEGDISSEEQINLYNLVERNSKLIHYQGSTRIKTSDGFKYIRSTMDRDKCLKGEL